MKMRKIREALQQSKYGLCANSLQMGTGPRCVIGELLFQTGWSNKKLRKLNGTLEVPDRWGPRDEWGQPILDEKSGEFKAREELKQQYGLTDRDIEDLMDLNDTLYFDEVEDDWREEQQLRLQTIVDMFYYAPKKAV